MTFARSLLASLALLVFLGAALLVGGAAWRAQAEETLRHGLVAERLFDTLEAELSDLIQREEQRSFLEYRHYYVPGRQALGASVGLVRSPLADPPVDGPVIGWFQIDPDGQLYLPHEPRESERGLAAGDGWRPAPDLAHLQAELAELVAAVDSAPEPAQVDAEPAVQSVASSFNRGVSRRSGRSPKTVQTQAPNLMGFVDNQAADLRDVVAPQAVDVQVDVQVEPFRGARVGDRWMLRRAVRIAGEPYTQGFVVDLPRLTRSLTAEVLTGPIAAVAELAWDHDPTLRVHRFDHAFAPPFDGLQAAVSLDRIPSETPDQRPLWLLTALLGLALAGGGFALDRAVVAQLEFARRRTDFVAAVSHELKTPLTSIRMYAEMLRDGMVLSDDHRQDYYSTIAAESERLSRLIGNVLELARLERGIPGRVEVGLAGPVLAEAVALLAPHAREAGFVLECAVDDGLPPVQLDRDALLQVLVNLVDNAIKFAGSAVDRRIVVSASLDGEQVCVRVRDFGPGVPESQRRVVFQPFVRGERELTRTTKGTGIGLALVRGLVAGMGGQVLGRNAPGGGWEVAVRLAAGPAAVR